ncbi:MAG: hypothetical protein JW870_19915 [Candidatus Delongbacteria bacterium]|nr:hypothetical protein [Candidatus Delongbacteria bacterium]
MKYYGLNVEVDLKVLDYDLPDIEILRSEKDFDFFIWVPDQTNLILGQSNNPEKSLNTEFVILDNIPVFKRPSGGETVVLTPKTIVLAFVEKKNSLIAPGTFFKKFNGIVMHALETLGISNVFHRGISDLTIGNKKILGSSIYMKPDRIFYHAVINVSESIDTITRYISHPDKEPDYRKGRSHNDFVTSISKEYPEINIERVLKSLKLSIADYKLKKEIKDAQGR